MDKLNFWYNRSRRFYELCTYYQDTFLMPFEINRTFQRAWDERAMYIASKYFQAINEYNDGKN